MKIQFSGEIFNFPPPVPGEGEAVISPERYFPIEVKGAATADRILSLFNVGKVLFFIYREGISLTVSKVLAVLSHRKLGRGRTLVVAIGRESETGRPAIALGGQDCPYAERLCFSRSLVSVAASEPPDHEADAAALIAYCAANPDVAAGLRNWSRFSGQEPEVTLAAAMRAGRSLIESGAPSGDVEAVTVEFPDAGDNDPAAGSAAPETARGRTGLFLAGAGTYPCAYALPIFRRAGIPFDTVIDLNPVRAAQVAKRFNFTHADTNSERGLRRLSAYEEPILVIATYHSTHADIVEQALTINPATKIMLEKPPVTTLEQLQRLNRFRRDGAYIEIGFNRRHIPMTSEAREQVLREDGPIVMTCIVKELVIPASHWYHWPDQGTRITGNVCHWLDLGRYFIAADPERMFVIGAVEKEEDEEDGVTIVVCYADGSRLHIVATDRGSSLRGVQEFIEIRRGDLTVTIADFLRMRIQAGARQTTRRRIIRDKGHRRMYARFMDNIGSGAPTAYPAEDLTVSTLQYLKASEAFRSGAPVTEIDLREPCPPQRAPGLRIG